MKSLPDALQNRLRSPVRDQVLAAVADLCTDAALTERALSGLTWHRSTVPGQMGYRRGPVLRLLAPELATEALHRLLLHGPDTPASQRLRSRVTHLYLEDAGELGDALAQFTALEDLRLGGAVLRSPQALGGLAMLRRVWLTDVALPHDLDGLAGAALRSVHLRGCDVRSLAGLGGASSLEHLELLACPALTDLSPLFGNHALRSLTVEDFAGERLGVLPHGLTRLEVNGGRLQRLHGLEGCTALRWLRVADCPVASLGPLAGCTGLEHIELARLAVTELTPLGGAPRLALLRLTHLPGLRDLHGLEQSESLEVLEVEDCALARWRDLPASERWVRVSVLRCPVGDLRLPRVTLPTLEVRDCPTLRTSTGLGRVAGLRRVDLRGCSALQDADGLVEASPDQLWLHGTDVPRRALPSELRARASWAKTPR